MVQAYKTIQLAQVSDARQIAMLSRVYIEDGLGWRWHDAKVRNAIADKSTNVVVAKEGGLVIAFGIMRYDEGKANLDLLGVRKGYRRQGLGKQVVNWLLAVAGNAGIFHVYVQLREKNASARIFYQRLDFQLVDHLKGYYRGRESALNMYKYTGKYT